MVRPIIILLLFMPLLSVAQKTIGASSYPSIGDTIQISKDNLPEGISLGDPGGPRIWDYKRLAAPYAKSTVFVGVANGQWSAEFPSANLLAKSEGGQETYYRKTNISLELLGSYGLDPLGIGVKGLGRYSKPKMEHHVPIRFLNNYESDFEFLMVLAVDDLPFSFLDSIPITPDSLRIRIIGKRKETVDAYGRTQMADNLHQGLRVRIDDRMIIKLDAKLPFLEWQDITDMLPENPYFGKRNETHFLYFSNREPGPIVTILAGGRRATEVASVQFMASKDQESMKQGLIPGYPGVLAYPNPAIQSTRFDFVNLTPGTYTLAMFNILGVKVYEQEWWIAGSKTVKVNLEDFKKGTYLYSLIDDRGKTISTKRLMIIRP